MNQFVLILALALFLACGFWVRKRDRFSNLREYALSRRGQSWLFIMAGISMTFVGGAATLNMAGLGYQYGWWSLVDPCAVLLGTLLVAFFIDRYRHGIGITISDLLSGADLRLSLVTGLVSLVVYLLLVAAQFVALSKLLAPFFPGVHPAVFTAILSAAVFSYILVNGLSSVTQTDLLQYCFVAGFLVPPILYVAMTIAPTSAAVIPSTAMPLDLFILLGFSVLFVPMSQDVTIRAKASRTKKDAIIGFLIGGFSYFAIVTACIFAGYTLARQGVVLSDPERALPTFFNTHYPRVGVFAIIAVFAAIASTLDSWAFAAIVTCANDILKRVPLFKRRPDEARIMWSSIAIFVVALAIALYFNKILGLILTGLLIYVAVLLPIALGNRLRLGSTPLFFTSLFTVTLIVIVELAQFPIRPKAVIYPLSHLLLVIVMFLVQKGRSHVDLHRKLD